MFLNKPDLNMLIEDNYLINNLNESQIREKELLFKKDEEILKLSNIITA